MEITNLLEFSHRAQLREWLEHYAATDKECWIAMYTACAYWSTSRNHINNIT